MTMMVDTGFAVGVLMVVVVMLVSARVEVKFNGVTEMHMTTLQYRIGGLAKQCQNNQ